jgi:hypothetical protein
LKIENEKHKIVTLISLHEAAVSIRMDAFLQFMSEHGWMCFVNEMRGGWKEGTVVGWGGIIP